MTGFWNSAATSRKMWMLSASRSWRWLRRGDAMSRLIVLVDIGCTDCLWRLDLLGVQKQNPQSEGSECGRVCYSVVEIEWEAIDNTRTHTDRAYSNRSCCRGDKPCWRRKPLGLSVDEYGGFVKPRSAAAAGNNGDLVTRESNAS